MFVFGMERSVAPYLLFTQRAAFHHVCVFADKARQLTHGKNRSTCLRSTSARQPNMLRRPEIEARGSESFFQPGPEETNPAGVMSPAQSCRQRRVWSDQWLHDAPLKFPWTASRITR